MKMEDTNGIGRHHFKVKTGIQEILDKMYSE